MLLIDGVKYELWTPEGENAEEELEQMVKEHAQDIFGENSIYLDKKQKLKSLAGVGSVPDGFVITFGDTPQWHIVEVELSSHQLYDHIVNQVGRFINGIKNLVTQRNIVDTIYREITESKTSKVEVEEAIGSGEIHKFISDIVSQPPVLTIIIEKKTPELEEAINLLKYSPIEIVEFRTFTREGVDLTVHAHLFEPLFQPLRKKIAMIERTKEEIPVTPKVEGRVTIQDLIDANIIEPGQTIYGWHKGKKYEARIMPAGEIKLLPDGGYFNSLSMAAFKGIIGHEVNGWNWWHTTRKNGMECKLDELRNEYKSNLSP